jgi:hypothetical protein
MVSATTMKLCDPEVDEVESDCKAGFSKQYKKLHLS